MFNYMHPHVCSENRFVSTVCLFELSVVQMQEKMTSERRSVSCIIQVSIKLMMPACDKARWLAGKSKIMRDEFATWIICNLLPEEAKGEEVGHEHMCETQQSCDAVC